MPLDPCGMIVDLIYECYTTKCRYFAGSSVECDIYWYPCAPGALPLPGGTIFQSRLWDVVHDLPQDLGEIVYRWRSYQYLRPRPAGALGRHFCGEPEQYRTGAVATPTARMPSGLTLCCVPPVPWFSDLGALGLGLVSDVSVVAPSPPATMPLFWIWNWSPAFGVSVGAAQQEGQQALWNDDLRADLVANGFLGLYVSGGPYTETNVFSDVVEAAWSGYARVALAPFVSESFTAPFIFEADGTTNLFNNSSGAPVTFDGYFLALNRLGGPVLLATTEASGAPQTILDGASVATFPFLTWLFESP